ncbi:MAG TPA: CPBP family glutamic-type intramembrane protease [Candidatus Krumholzibacteria bacterium]
MSTPETSDARRVVVGASLVFGILLLGGGALILWARGLGLLSVFDRTHAAERALLGAGIGAGVAVVCALAVARLRFLGRLRRLAEHAVDGIEPRWHTVLVVSVAAGISEEFFFRGVLEPAVGRWFASLAFIAVHGALRLRERGAPAFAVFLFGASMGLSAINAWKGLEAAMAAHAAYDLVMFAWLARRTGAATRTH